jgi:hypothetical protein
MDADLRAPELAQIARVSRQETAMFDDDLVTNKPWSNRVPLPLAAQDSGVIVSLPPPAVATAPRAAVSLGRAAVVHPGSGARRRRRRVSPAVLLVAVISRLGLHGT